MANAGRILIMPKGDYDASVTYEMLDLVFHNGTSWVAKKTVVNIEPSIDNNIYWQAMFNIEDILPDIEMANNLTTVEAGKALDAMQGKILNDKISNKAVYYQGTTTEVVLEYGIDKYIAQFTAPETGLYFVYGQTQISVTSAGNYSLSFDLLDVNGVYQTSKHVSRNISGSGGGGGNVAGFFELKKDDVIALKCIPLLTETTTNRFTYLDIIKL